MATITTKAGPWNMTVFVFAEDDADNPLGRLGGDDVHRLPYGAVELDRDGRVVAYNDTEPDDSGVSASTLIGANFFSEVCRWADSSRVAEEFHAGVASGELNSVFDCAVKTVPYKVRIHLKISPILATYWVFIKKLARAA
jgi:photoactive yellow protein